MDKSLIELADHAQVVLAKLEAMIKVAHVAAEKEHIAAGNRADKAEEDEVVDPKVFSELCTAEDITGKNDDHLTAAHADILTALNSIIDVGIHLRGVK